jgi:F0F1-type ATP synthase beta subunit
MLNLFGEPIDRREPPRPTRMPVHRAPLPLARRVTSREIFATGIKAIDLLAPLEARRQGGAVRRRRRRQDGADHRDDPQHGRPTRA